MLTWLTGQDDDPPHKHCLTQNRPKICILPKSTKHNRGGKISTLGRLLYLRRSSFACPPPPPPHSLLWKTGVWSTVSISFDTPSSSFLCIHSTVERWELSKLCCRVEAGFDGEWNDPLSLFHRSTCNEANLSLPFLSSPFLCLVVLGPMHYTVLWRYC